MRHIIYKTICQETGKYYIGMHSTENIDDGYLGSGKVVRASVKKYGALAHTKEILEELPDRISLALRESEIVNDEVLSDPLCMNLKPGGAGNSSEYAKQLFQNPEFREKHSIAVSDGMKGKTKTEEHVKALSKSRKKLFAEDPSVAKGISDRLAERWKSDEFREKNVAALQSSWDSEERRQNTSEFMKEFWNRPENKARRAESARAARTGTCWICHPDHGAKSIKKELLASFESQGWKRGRK